MAKKRDIYKIGKQKVPSVTQITGMLAKPGLVPWAANMAVEHIMKFTPQAPGQWIVTEAMLGEAKNAHRIAKEDAGAFGSNIHSLVGAYVEGQLHIDGVENTKERKALENFIIATEGWEWLGSETVVYHDPEEYMGIGQGDLFSVRTDESEDYGPNPKSFCLPYGGTTDALARLPDGRIVIVDFKTSKGVYPEHSLQIAMYAYAQPVDPALREYWSQIVDGRILHFDKERLTWEALERDVEVHYQYIPHFRHVYEWVKTFSDK